MKIFPVTASTRPKQRPWIRFAFGMICMCLQSSTEGATLSVATWGSDLNAGTEESPLRSIQRAVAKLKPGDLLLIRDGIYPEAVKVSVSGTPEAPIQITNYPGERAIIDGQGRLAANFGALVNVQGNYVIISGLEVRNGLGMGVILSGHHNLLRYADVHDHAERGVRAAGDFSVVEYSRIWNNAWNNCRLATCAPSKYPNGGWGTGLSAARDPVDGITNNAVLRGNTVFNNWGEGLSSFEADGTLLEANVVYDNFATNIYISNSPNTKATKNLVYVSPGTPMQRIPPNIGLADETSVILSENIVLTNNLVVGGSPNLAWWLDKRTLQASMKNVLVAHNTFIEAFLGAGATAAITFANGPHVNVRLSNNLVYQRPPGQPITLGRGQFSFSSNLWSTPPQIAALSATDVVTDPMISQFIPIFPGELNTEWFKPEAGSPAIWRAPRLAEVGDDYFGIPRMDYVTFGAIDF